MKLISNKRNTTCFLYYLQNKNLVYLEIITIITVIKNKSPRHSEQRGDKSFLMSATDRLLHIEFFAVNDIDTLWQFVAKVANVCIAFYQCAV